MKSTSEVSKIAGVSRRTLQYYDDEDVLSVMRTDQNYRVYDQTSMDILWQIMVYKKMGFSLKEVKQLLTQTEDEKQKTLEEKISVITRKEDILEVQKKCICRVMKEGMPTKPKDEEQTDFVTKLEIWAMK